MNGSNLENTPNKEVGKRETNVRSFYKYENSQVRVECSTTKAILCSLSFQTVIQYSRINDRIFVCKNAVNERHSFLILTEKKCVVTQLLTKRNNKKN